MNQIKDPNPNLPERLFAVDCYPDKARLNIYSRPEYLGTIANLLKGSEEWERIKSSQFGKLFEFPVARCSHSGKLIHGLLSRQVVTKKKHELWFVFGGHPIRFSIREFHIVTGLRCGKLPTEDEVKKHQDSKYLSVWNRLFGEKRMVTIGDVLEMLQKKKLSSWKKLCLALIVIVDGVVVCNDQSFVTLDFVEMLNDIDFFLEYPWGRKAFLATIRRFGPPKDAPNPLGKLKKRLKQKTSACYGFPLALQLQVFESIPVILERIKDPNDLRDFTERSSEGLSIAFLLRKSYILDAEVDDKLVVAHTLEPKGMINESELVWETEVSDPKVDYILRLINEGHCFKPFEWPHLKAANQEVNIPDIDGDSLEDVTDVSQARPKKPLTRSSKKEKEVVKPPSIHKHTSQEKIKAKVHVGGESNDPGYVTLAYLNDMKEWILKQNQDLRNKIREDVKEIVVGPKSPAGGASNLRQSNRLNTNSKGKTDASPPKKTGNTETRKRKRKQVEVHSLSSGSESAGDIEGEEDVQSTWKEDGNAPSSGTFDECDDYGGALKITQEGDVMQEESDFDHCSSNCTKMKESMMREIENLELKLQLYGGHGLNNLTYDELLHFEHQLESSLHIARAHKQEQQQQQTDKLKENLMVCQRHEDDDIMHRQVKKENPPAFFSSSRRHNQPQD
ncbi:EST gb/Z33866 comes from this gene [Arabidopsis thaliana]|jgi:hypothetical protein|uniref:F28K20.8 protein n=2 Tax=Arabidopsis thaliana TaxID=3702 RepID=Q9SA08_ARATH|nr:K-box region protein (DUF1985) [Arabidopsis thaliana]AAD21698.1 EST gb/Z33866 comes from this gene [Arabidopsis thaliana]AEE31318.1 K-box region protein (DUF1985) [Arabidopsis thaliana]CAA0259238.1 unnamed protein product [Arabidopsis thaliana]|eukprot:NP_174400.1 K-box region protein (DUF1985) [Arabidopsis thaliana]